MAPTGPIPGNPIPPPLAITQETLLTLQQAIASGVRTVRFQDRTIEYASIDDLIKAANYLQQLLAGQGAITGAHRQIRLYTNKGL